MRRLLAAALLLVLSAGIYWPHKNAEFVLDDYYTVVRNPLIKNPSLYQDIWHSHLFDAHQSSGYIKFGYYRPVLESSWILDYRLFGLDARGYQWINLLVHFLNCLFVFILIIEIFGQYSLGLKASILFCILPTQEWVVRYVTGRGDELSTLFALIALVIFTRVLKKKSSLGYIFVFIFWALAALTREVAIAYIMDACLIYFTYTLCGQAGKDSGRGKEDISRFAFIWFIIGIVPFFALWSIIPKQGNILIWHVFYFGSIGLCLWMAQWTLKWFILLCLIFSSVSAYQGQFWTKEENLLRHTQSLEIWPRTVAAQQLLMKYDKDIPAIEDMAAQSHDPYIKAMWLRRLGVVYFEQKDFDHAQLYFNQALSVNSRDVDSLNALAVVYHYKGQEDLSLKVLNQSLVINPAYPDTLRTLGIYYYVHHDLPKARNFLSHCLALEPSNQQAQELLKLANASK